MIWYFVPAFSVTVFGTNSHCFASIEIGTVPPGVGVGEGVGGGVAGCATTISFTSADAPAAFVTKWAAR